MGLFQSVAKKLGYIPTSQVRAAINGFQAAALGRLVNDWSTSTLSADAQARNDLLALIARSRDLRDNYDYAKAFLRMCKTNVLGQSGMHFKNRAKDPDRVEGGRQIPGKLDVFANTIIEDNFWEWGKKANCTVSRDMSWCDVQKVVLESTGTDGQILVRKVRGFDNPFRFALQLFDFDFVDFHLNVPRTSRGTEIRMGIEINQWHEKINYYLLKRNPNDSYCGLESWGDRHEILPAKDVIHPFIRYRPRQTQGIPWMVTSAERMKMLKGYEEAELVASRVAAAKMGFFQSKGDTQYEGEDDAAGNKLMEAEPGSFEQLPTGLELAAWDPQHPNSNYPQVHKAWLRGVAAGLGVSYHTLANDMEAVNFASGMIGLGEERDAWMCMQYWFAEDFCEPVFEAWLESAIITGNVPLPMSKFKKFNAPDFTGRRWSFVNPGVEVDALKKRLDMRVTTLSSELRKLNLEPAEVFQEISDERKEMERLGILPEEVVQALADAKATEMAAENPPEAGGPARNGHSLADLLRGKV